MRTGKPDVRHFTGEPIPVELMGVGSVYVRAAPMRDLIEGEDMARFVAAHVVDVEGRPVLSVEEARDWLDNRIPASVAVEVHEKISQLVGLRLEEEDLVHWLKDRPLLRIACSLAREWRCSLREVLDVPEVDLRLFHAAMILDKIEGVGS